MDRLFRRHHDDKVEPAYWHGYQDGVSAEREKNSVEWAQFFETAKLKNTISGVPIKSREDFYEWKEEYEAVQNERKKRSEDAARKKNSETRRRKIEHFSYVTKEESAHDVVHRYATKIEKLLSERVDSLNRGKVYYVCVGALCSWAELLLNEKRELMNSIIEFVSNADGETAGGIARLKRIMYTSADTVGFAIEGKERGQIFVSASKAIQTLLCLDEDIEIQSQISALLGEFLRVFVEEKQLSV